MSARQLTSARRAAEVCARIEHGPDRQNLPSDARGLRGSPEAVKIDPPPGCRPVGLVPGRSGGAGPNREVGSHQPAGRGCNCGGRCGGNGGGDIGQSAAREDLPCQRANGATYLCVGSPVIAFFYNE